MNRRASHLNIPIDYSFQESKCVDERRRKAAARPGLPHPPALSQSRGVPMYTSRQGTSQILNCQNRKNDQIKHPGPTCALKLCQIPTQQTMARGWLVSSWALTLPGPLDSAAASLALSRATDGRKNPKRSKSVESKNKIFFTLICNSSK
jgi:hypothetical protein